MVDASGRSRTAPSLGRCERGLHLVADEGVGIAPSALELGPPGRHLTGETTEGPGRVSPHQRGIVLTQRPPERLRSGGIPSLTYNVVPGAPEESILSLRASSASEGIAMPHC